MRSCCLACLLLLCLNQFRQELAMTVTAATRLHLLTFAFASASAWRHIRRVPQIYMWRFYSWLFVITIIKIRYCWSFRLLTHCAVQTRCLMVNNTIETRCGSRHSRCFPLDSSANLVCLQRTATQRKLPTVSSSIR